MINCVRNAATAIPTAVPALPQLPLKAASIAATGAAIITVAINVPTVTGVSTTPINKAMTKIPKFQGSRVPLQAPAMIPKLAKNPKSVPICNYANL